MQEAYARRGYIFAQIEPQITNFDLKEETLKNYENCLNTKNPKSRKKKDCKETAGRLNLKLLRQHLKDNPEHKGLTLRHIHFRVRENNLAYVENIIIRGNDKTQTEVIRREILLNRVNYLIPP